MASDTSLVFNLIARDRISPELNNVNGRFSRLRDSMKGLIGPAVAFAGVNMLKGFVNDARESAVVGAMLEQRIKQTGASSWTSAAQIDKLVTGISNKTGADDEAIASGSALLLTFKNVKNEVGAGNDIFNQATVAATDMAAAMNGGEVTAEGLKSANIQLGKALNDPLKGISALSKVGVSFTAEQKKSIETFMKQGDVMSAQKVILKELGGEFGGAAEAAATPMKKLQTSLGNMGETIGTALLPFIDKMTTKLTGIVNFVTANASWLVPTVGAVVALGGAIFVVVKAIQAWTAIQAALNVVMAMNPVGLIIIGIAALIAIIVLIATKTTWFQTLWKNAWGLIKGAASAVWNWLKSNWPYILGILTGPIGMAVVLIVKHWNTIKKAISTVLAWVKTAASAAWNFVKSTFSAVTNWFSSRVAWVRGKFSALWSFIKQAGSSAWNTVKGVFSGGFNWLSGKVNSVVSMFRGLPGRIASATSGMFNGIKNAFRSAINFVIGGWNRLQFSVGLPKIPSWVPGIGGKGGGSVTIGTPNIPMLAKGGTITGGGSVIVGERGPEMLHLPRGAQVDPNIGGGRGTHVTIEFKKTGNGLMDKFLDELQDAIRVRGGDVQTVIGTR